MQKLGFVLLAWCWAIPCSSVWAQLEPNHVPESTTRIVLTRRYKEGESPHYRMTATNKGRKATIRYEARADGKVRKDAAGNFVEEFQWSALNFNGQPVALPAESEFRQFLSLDPEVPPSPPDFSHVNPMLIGPSADLLTFYADLWLAITQGSLAHAGDHTYVKNGSPNSWADGARTLVGQDSIDFDLRLSEVNAKDGTAKLIVRHVPPPQPQIQRPAKWMESPVADTPNNWVEVSKLDGGKYLAEIGKETFDVEITLSLADGKILHVSMDNPVVVSARECTDSALSHCEEAEQYQIRRQIELWLVR